MAPVLEISVQFPLVVHKKDTQNFLPDVVPVESVPAAVNELPKVTTKDDTPDVVIINVHRCPAVPPLALNVTAAVGVQV